ncbi:MAG: phosphatidate cytidylyltransferase [Mycoplasma sp.]|nr:phosphatidate cytidylyltransferase [Mycoplasma sp.]
MKAKAKINYRYISAIVLIVILAPLFYILSEQGIIGRSIGLSIFLLIGTYTLYESTKHLKINLWVKFSPTIFMFVFFFIDWDYLDSVLNANLGVNNITLIGGLIDWSYILIPILFYILLMPFFYEIKMSTFFYLMSISIIIPIFFKSLFSLSSFSWEFLILLVSVTVISDTMAYFGGSLFGKTKLAPNISPKKTWEGAITGYVFAILFIGLFCYFTSVLNGVSNFWIAFSLLLLFLPIASVFGDLLFSKIKRESNIKDFSNIIPGHGGILDRIDSLILVTIVFVIIVSEVM